MINREAIDLAILDYAIEKRRGIICSSNHEDGIERIDLMHYCDRGPLTVHPHTTVARAYMVFRKLGFVMIYTVTSEMSLSEFSSLALIGI